MTTNKTALIVDDALFMREVIRDTLNGLVNVIYDANGPEDAIVIAQDYLPNLITLDLTLDAEEPVQGFRVLEELSVVSPDSKIIVVSAIDQKCIRSTAIKKGAYTYVKKPFEREVFRETVRSILEEQK